MGRSAGIGASSLRATVLLRSGWRASIALGVLAGLGAGGVIGLATLARDTGSALDRYVRSLHAPDVVATICPPGVDASGPGAELCLEHDPVDELEAVRQDKDVIAAGRVSPAPLLARTPQGWVPAFGWVAYDDIGVYGSPYLVAGRRADPTSADEAEVSEALARRFHVGVGSQLDVFPLSWEQLKSADLALAPELPVRSLRITGVVRVPADLVPREADGPSNLYGEMVFLGPGWVKAVGEHHFASFLIALGLYLKPGATAQAALDWAAPGQARNIETGLSATDVADTRSTVAYEARAALAAALLLFVAVAVFIGQMIVRQAGGDLGDSEPLRALGMNRRQVVASALPRWLVTATVAVVVATPTAALIRPVGPFGVARRAVARVGPSWNLAVLAAGLLMTLLFVVVVALLTTFVSYGVRAAAAPRARPIALPLPVAPMMGLAITNQTATRRWTPRATAVLGSALAVAAVIAAPTLIESLERLTTDPARYGVAWDAFVSGPTGKLSAASFAERLATLDGVAAAAGFEGNTAHIGNHQLYVYTLAPIAGLPTGIRPTITRGRAPAAVDEIALGSRSLASVGAQLGDTVRVNYLDTERDLRVVGEVVVNDGHEPVPGLGAFVTPEWLSSVDKALYVSDFAVRFRPEMRTSGIGELKAELPDWTSLTNRPRSIVNLERISGWPPLLAAITAGMAAVAFVHALVTSVRDHRRQLAVLKALGSSRRQVGAGVLWHASFLALPAILIGVPLGIMVGRAGWGVFARNVGVTSGPVVPVLTVAIVAAVTLLVTNVLAVIPAWRAAHAGTAEGLRAE